jgi:glycosyltransferase involved in cell wall biosynthesis
VRIAIYHNLPSGGGKRALYELTRHFTEGHILDIYTLSTSDHEFCDLRPYSHSYQVFPFTPFPLANSPFGRLNQGIRAVDLLRLRRIQRSIAQKIDRINYDVVFVHHCRFGQSPSLLKFLKTPSVYYCQEPPRLLYEPPVPRPYTEFSRVQRLGNWFDPFPGIYRRTLARLDCQNMRAATRVLVNSHYSRETLYRTYGIFAQVAYLGVDTEKFHPLGLPRENFVLSVGALNPHKGFDFLIESLAFLETAQRPQLVIVSNFQDARERQFLERLAAEKQVRVTFKVMIPDEDLVRLYNQAQLTLYAPIMEPFGFVPLESMACGTPVVGVREAGVRETVRDGVTGVLTEREPRWMAAAIQNLLNAPPLMAEYSAKSREDTVTRWSWEHASITMERFLNIEGEICNHS